MSSIDERIVQMKFDNGDFERNVNTSIGTLSRLKEALKFNDVSSSLSNIEKNVNAADFSKLASSIDSISNRFSNWGIVGMKVIQDLTGAAEKLGMKLYSSTIGQVQSGGWNRATNIDKARFAIEGLGYSYEELKTSIQQAVDQTRFGFDEAASAASQLVASNVAVGDEMTNALSSISAVASQTGDEYSSIAHIYTTVAGNGKLMTEQLNQFSYRGLNAAALIAKAMNKTEAEIREMTTAGEIDFKTFSDAMLKGLGDTAGRANETFEGSLANMKAALSRIGEPYAKSIRDSAIPVFNRLREIINDTKNVITPVSEVFTKFLKKATNLLLGLIKPGTLNWQWLENIVDSIGHLWDIVDAFMTKLTPLWTDVLDYSEKTAEAIKPITDGVKKASEAVAPLLEVYDGLSGASTSLLGKANEMFSETVETVDQAATTSEHIDEMARRVISGEFGNGQTRFSQLEEAGENWKVIQNRVNELLGSTYRYEAEEENLSGVLADQNKELEENTDKLEKNNKKIIVRRGAIGALVDLYSSVKEKLNEIILGTNADAAIEKVSNFISGINAALEIIIRTFSVVINSFLKPAASIVGAIVDTASTLGEWFYSLRDIMNQSSFFLDIEKSLGKFGWTVADAFNAISEKIREVLNSINKEALVEKLGKAIQGVASLFSLIVRVASIVINAAIKPLASLLGTIISTILDVVGAAGEVFANIKEKAESSGFFTMLEQILNVVFGIASAIGSTFAQAIGTGFQIVIAIAEKLYDVIFVVTERVHNFIGAFKETESFKRLSAAFTKLSDKLIALKEKGFEAVQKAIEKFKNTKVKLPTVNFDKFLEIAEKIADKITDFLVWLADKIDVNAVIDGIASGLETVFSIINNLATILYGAFRTALAWVSEHFGSLISAIKDAPKHLKELWETFKETKAFKNISDGFDKVKEKASTAKDNIVDFFKNSFTDEEGNFKLPEFSWENIKQAFYDAWEWLKQKFEEVKNWFKEKWSNIFGGTDEEGNFKFFDLDTMNESINGVKDYLLEKAGDVQDLFSNLFSSNNTKESEEGTNAIIGFFDGLKERVPSLGTIIDTIKNLVLTFIKLKILWGVASTIFNLGGIFRQAKKTVKEFRKILQSIAGMFTSLSGGIKEISDQYAKGIKRISKATARELNARAILEIAAAIAILAFAFYNLGSMSEDQVTVATKAIAAIAIALGALFIIVGLFVTKNNKSKDPLEALSKAIYNVGNGIKEVGKGLKKIGIAAIIGTLTIAIVALIGLFDKIKEYSWNDITKSVIAIGAVLAELVVAVAVLNLLGGNKSFGNQIGKAAMIVFLGISIKMIAEALIKISDISIDKLETAVDALTSIMGLVALVIAVTSFITNSSGKGTRNGLFGQTEEYDNKKANTAWKNILSMALLISAIGWSLSAIGNLDINKLEIAKDALFTVSEVAVAIMLAASFSTDTTKTGGREGKSGISSAWDNTKTNVAWKNILSTALLIAVIAGSLSVLAGIDESKLKTAEDALSSIVGLALAIIAAASFSTDTTKNSNALNSSKTNKAWKNIALTIALIVSVTGSLYILATIKESKLKRATDSIEQILNICASIMTASIFITKSEGKTSKNNKAWTAIISTIGLIMAVTTALYFLANGTNDISKLEAASEAISKVASVAVILAVASAIMNSAFSKSATGAGGVTDYGKQWSSVAAGLVTAGALLAEVCVAFQWILSLDFDPGKLEEAGTALCTALIGVAIAFFGANSLRGLNIEGAAVAGVVAGVIGLISGILTISDYIAESFFGYDIYGENGPIEKMKDAVRAIGELINSFVSGLFGTDNIGEDIENGIGDFLSGFGNVGENINNVIEKIKSIDVTGLVTTIGDGLKQIPGILIDVVTDLKTFLDKAKEINVSDLTGLLAVFGILVGTTIVDFITGIEQYFVGDNGIVKMATRLNKDFADPFIEFLEKMKNSVNSDDLTALKSVMGTLVEITLLEGFESLFNWLFGNTGLTKITENLPKLATAMADYSAALEGKTINKQKMLDSAEAAEAIIKVANQLPNVGGILQDFTGTPEDIAKFGTEVVTFARGISAANWVLTKASLDKTVFETAAEAGEKFAELANQIPAVGGILQDFTGTQDIAEFGKQVVAYARAMSATAWVLQNGTPIKEDDVKTIANCGDILATLEKTLPKSGGKLQEWLGSQDLGKFGERIELFGAGLVAFNNSVHDENGNMLIDQGAINAAYDAGAVMNLLESALTTHDGLLQMITGDSRLDDFGTRLEKFGSSLVTFSNIITGKSGNKNAFNTEAVDVAITTLQGLWDFVERAEGSSDIDTEPVSDFWMALMNGEDVISKIIDFYKMLGSDILSQDALAGSGVQEAFKEVGGEFLRCISAGMIEKLNGEGSDTGNTFIESLGLKITGGLRKQKVLDDAETSGEKIGKAISDSFTEIFGDDTESSDSYFGSDVIKAFKELVEKIISEIDSHDVHRDFISVGRRWIAQIINGVKVKVYEINKTAEAVKDGVIKALSGDSDYGLNNDFYNIGSNWMQYLFNSMEDWKTALVNEAQSIADAVKAALDGTQDGLNTSPVITPVVDYSKIQNDKGISALSLRDVWSGLNTSGISRSADMLSSILPNNYQSNDKGMSSQTGQETLASLNGIRSDIKALSEDITNMNVILDSGALVGNISGGIDRKLGSVQNLKRRWT